MAITVNCRCGRTYRVADDLAGRRLKCRSCGAAIVAAGAASGADLFDDSFFAPPPASLAQPASFLGPGARAGATRDHTSGAGPFVVVAVAVAGLVVALLAGGIVYMSVSSHSDTPETQARAGKSASLGAAARPQENSAESTGSATSSESAPREEPKPPSDRYPWERFTSQRGGYSILMPGSSRDVSNPAERHKTIVQKAVLGDEQSASVIYYDTTPADPDMLAGPEAHLDLLAYDSNGRVLEKKRIALDGHSGREAIFEEDRPGRGPLFGHIRVFFVEGRVYYISWIGPKGSFLRADAETFLDSFRLL